MSYSIEIPARSFYSGSTKKQFYNFLSKKRKRLKLENEFKKRPLPNVQIYDHCFSERKVWKWFIRQQEAIDFCNVKDEKCLCIFAYEKANGKRSYLVTTRRQFWERYKRMSLEKRHFYEVIRQSDQCRLYFDIEFLYEFNPGLDGESVLEIFINYISYCIYKQFGIVCSEKHVIVLHSSTDTKFSKHLIFNHLGVLFNDNIQCGQFVKNCCQRLKEYVVDGKTDNFLPVSIDDSERDSIGFNFDKLSASKLKDVLIKTDKGGNFLCDLCVYTRNRNFRLFLSSKVSKHVPLELSENNKFQFKSKPSRKEKYLKYQMRNICFDAEFEKFADTLVCPGEDDKNKFLSFGNENKENIKKHYPGSSGINEGYETGSQTSSYPALDKFVIQIVNRNGPPGHIRRWMYYEKSQMMIYDIGNNRWCGNIQREHKSNHIYFVADLKFAHVYQKCHDFECNDYRSGEIPIPREINPIFSSDHMIEEFNDTMDEELMELFDSDIDVISDVQERQKNEEQSRSAIKLCEKRNSTEEEFFTEEDSLIDEELLKLSGFNALNVSEKRPSEAFFTEEDSLIDEELSKLSGFDTMKVCQKRPNVLTFTQEAALINEEVLKLSGFDALNVCQKRSKDPFSSDEDRLIDEDIMKLSGINTVNVSQKRPCDSCDSPSMYLRSNTEEEEIERGMLNLSNDSFTSTTSNTPYQQSESRDKSMNNSMDLFYGSSQFQDTIPFNNDSFSCSQTDNETELNELFSEDISISHI